MRKATLILILLVITIPIGYLGLMYASATSARFSISSIGLQSNPIEALVSRQLN